MKIIVPIESLRPETLRAVIEEFVTRSGAVHGHTDIPLDQQIESVRHQLRSGKAVIVFDQATDSWTICRREEIRIARTNGEEADSVDCGIESKEP